MEEKTKISLPITVIHLNKRKGFLRNKAKLGKLVAALQSPETPEDDNSLAEFVLMFTLQPVDRTEAMELILDLTNEELMEAVTQINGVPVVPLANAAPSETTTQRAAGLSRIG